MATRENKIEFIPTTVPRLSKWNPNFSSIRTEPLVNHFLPTPEDKKRALETIQRHDPLIRLGMSQGPLEVWKSLLWWGIFVLGDKFSLVYELPYEVASLNR